MDASFKTLCYSAVENSAIEILFKPTTLKK